MDFESFVLCCDVEVYFTRLFYNKRDEYLSKKSNDNLTVIYYLAQYRPSWLLVDLPLRRLGRKVLGVIWNTISFIKPTNFLMPIRRCFARKVGKSIDNWRIEL